MRAAHHDDVRPHSDGNDCPRFSDALMRQHATSLVEARVAHDVARTAKAESSRAGVRTETGSGGAATRHRPECRYGTCGEQAGFRLAKGISMADPSTNPGRFNISNCSAPLCNGVDASTDASIIARL